MSRSFVAVIWEVYVEIMTFEFNKVGDGINASECVECVGLGDPSNGSFEGPRANGIDVHFIPRGCDGMPWRQKTVLQVTQEDVTAVSYTHLTLPTNREV